MLKQLIESGQSEIHMIIFKLGSEEYSVPITDVQEIIMPQEATRIPKSPEFVLGVANLRGQIIPIIDGKKKFKIAGSKFVNEANERVMIVEAENQTVGLIVDEVSEVAHILVADIEPPPIEINEENSFLWGVGKYNGRLLILLDSKKFLSFDASHDLQSLKDVCGVLNISDKLVAREK